MKDAMTVVTSSPNTGGKLLDRLYHYRLLQEMYEDWTFQQELSSCRQTGIARSYSHMAFRHPMRSRVQY